MIHGAIDYVEKLQDGRVKIGGWAVYSDGKVQRAADSFCFSGGTEFKVIKTPRTDIKVAPDCGFNAILASGHDLAALHWKGVRLEASALGEKVVIPVWKNLEKKILTIVELYLTSLLFGGVGHVAAKSAAVKADPTLEGNRVIRADKLTPLAYGGSLIQVGSVSLNGDATIGKSGFLFLIGGTNEVLEQYSAPLNTSVADAWEKIIRDRSKICGQNNASFFQMIIPEKQSVLHELFPGSISGSTHLFAELNKRLEGAEFNLDCNINLRSLFVMKGLFPYRKVDTHLSYFGAESLVEALLGKLRIAADIFPVKLQPELRNGDLGSKFFFGEMAETLLMPVLKEWSFGSTTPTMTFKTDNGQQHSNVVYQWASKSPILAKKVLIFGNSMFERGGSPLGLSWWLSRIFGETRFVWTGGFLLDHVDEFRPDVIICQTVERFLPTVPST